MKGLVESVGYNMRVSWGLNRQVILFQLDRYVDPLWGLHGTEREHPHHLTKDAREAADAETKKTQRRPQGPMVEDPGRTEARANAHQIAASPRTM